MRKLEIDRTNKKPFYFVLIKSLLILFTVISCETTEPLLDHFSPRGTYEIKLNDLPAVSNTNLRLGGFTGLFYAGNRDFYSVTGRGPVIQKIETNSVETFFLAPNFTPQIVHFQLQDDQTVKVVNTIKIKNPANNDVSGLPPSGVWSNDETITNDEELSDDWGLFPGGIYFDVDNNFFWIAEQYSPGAYQLAVNGKWVKRLRPGEGYRLNFAKHTVNGGFTGIDFDRFGNIITVLGRCLEHNRNVNDPDQNRPINYALRRIAMYDPNYNSDYSFFYFVEPQSLDGIPDRFVELTGVLSVNDTSFLVLEEGNYNGLTRNLIYEAIVTDSTSKVVEGLEGLENRTFETLDSLEWKDNGLNALKKNLVADLSNEGLRKIEGMSIVDNKHIAVIENNNFGVINGNPNSGEYQIDSSPIKLKIITLSKKLKLKR